MDNLKGRTLLIGREEVEGHLMVAVDGAAGGWQTTVVPEPLPPHTVSRCKPKANTAHCKIEISPSSDMMLTNMNAHNVTRVNGNEVATKHITPESKIELGSDSYALPLKTVLSAASKLLPYSLAPLEAVWDAYHDGQIEIKKRQRKVNLLRSIAPIFTLGSAVVTTFLPANLRIIGMVPTFLGLIVFIISFFMTAKDKSIEEEEKLKAVFLENYVCPNPECRHFMGNHPYKILKQNKKCPYCGSALTDK